MSAFDGRVRRHFLAAGLAACFLAACSSKDDGSPNVIKNVTLSGAQENPAVTTAAAGTGFFSVNPDSGFVTGTITTFGITATAAHIHEGPVGVNAPVIVPLTQGPPGTWTVPAGSQLLLSQLDSFNAGNLYVNVHSAANPGGEIRAQIGRQVFYATLTGAQEVPPASSSATGTGVFVFDPETRRMSGQVTTSSVTATAGHIHIAPIGTSAGVAIPFTGGPSTFTMPATVLTQAQLDSLTAGNFYANIHSAAFPGGEIRGQLYTPIRTAALSGSQEVPPATTSASGVCWFFVNPFTKGVAGRTETTGMTATAAHAHRAVVGVSGPVVIAQTSPSAGVWVTAAGATISDDLLASFMKDELYCNVHSAAYPGGEIRGQLRAAQ